MKNRYVLWLVILFSVICVSSPVIARELESMDVWTTLEFQDEIIGHANYSLTKIIDQDGARYEYREWTCRKYYFGIEESMEIIVEVCYVYDEDWNLKEKIMYYESIDGESSVITCCIQEDVLEYRINQGDQIVTRYVDLPEDFTHIPSYLILLSMEDNNLYAGQSFKGHYIDMRLLGITGIEVVVKGKDTYIYEDEEIDVYEMVTYLDSMKITSLVGFSGEEYYSRYYQRNYDDVTFDVRRIDHIDSDDYRGLSYEREIIYSNKVIPRYWDLSSMTVRASIYDESLENIDFEDVRTTITDTRHLRTSTTLTLNIEPERENLSGLMDLSEYDSLPTEIMEYTSPTDFIRDGKVDMVKDKAIKVVGDETDVWSIAIKLASWIEENIDFTEDAIAYAPSVILESRVSSEPGKDTLFMTMLRTLGIPVRLVCGYEYMDSLFLPSSWYEIWMGQWVSFAGFNIIKYHTPLKLKTRELVANDFGISTYYFCNLRNKLDLAVVDYDYKNIGDMPAETGVFDKTFVNAEYGVEFSVPSENWLIVPTEEGGVPLVYMGVVDEENLIAYVVIGNEPRPGTDLDDFAKMMEGTVFSQFPNYSAELDKTVLDGGYDSIIADGTFGYGIHEGVIVNYYVLHNRIGCLFVMAGTKGIWEKYREDFEFIIQSLKFLYPNS